MPACTVPEHMHAGAGDQGELLMPAAWLACVSKQDAPHSFNSRADWA